MLARRLLINVEQHGMLYTPVEDLKAFGDTMELITAFNANLYYKHGHRALEQDKDNIFIRGRRPPAFSSGTIWSPGLL